MISLEEFWQWTVGTFGRLHIGDLSGYLVKLVAGFYDLTSWLQMANAALPNGVMTGFTVSFVVCNLLLVPILYAVLRVVWVLAAVGPARKAMTTFFILCLGVPLYPVVTALVLAFVWLGLGFSVLILSSFGPAALGFQCLILLCECTSGTIKYEQSKALKMQRRNQVVEDITCWELICGLLIGILSCCSFGLLSLLLTILKSPLVILSFVLRFAYESLCRWLILVRCGCRPVCSLCMPSGTLLVGAEARKISDLRSEGFSAKDLKDLGAEVGDLYAAGFTIAELSDGAEFRGEDFQGAGLGTDFDWHQCGGACWWWWFPLIFLTWLSALACLICMLLLMIVLSSIVKLILAVIWPAYISAGWLRLVTLARRRAAHRTCCEPLVQGLKAGYQIMWAGAMLTNICILNRTVWAKFELVMKTIGEVIEFAKGDRVELSADLRSLSLFPPVVVGLFTDSWDMQLRVLARRLEVSPNTIQEAWRGLARQMIRLGRVAIEEELITEEWVQEVPGELCIGLPARALLEAVERSPRGELVLVGGFSITAERVSDVGMDFADKLWTLFCDAQEARNAAQLSTDAHALLCAAILAGGGDPDSLPAGLAEAVKRYENLPKETYDRCQAILRPLIAFGLECGRQSQFKEKLELVIQSMAEVNSEDITEYLFQDPCVPTDVEEGSLSTAISSGDSDAS